MAHDGQSSSYACKCLNVRIHPLPPPGPSEEIADADFFPVYVGEEGISVAHVQMTLRSKGPRLDRRLKDSQQPVRYTTLTCLVCQSVVYRVLQTTSSDVETGEGPVLPNEDWAENEVLKSAAGWIELSKQCLSGNSVLEAEASPLYSRTFGIVLPSGVSSAPSAMPLYTPPSPSSPPQTPSEAPRTILPPLPALFHPPPFTPAHPVFIHLSAAATAESEKIRASAEEELKKIVEAKVDEIKAAEERLKHEVELLWSTFKGVVDKYEEEINPSRRTYSSRKRSGSRTGPHPGVNGTAASVRVVDFVPAPTAPSRALSPSLAASHPVSALSASLATSSIHQAMAQAQAEQEASSSRRSGRPTSPARPGGVSGATRAVSPSTASSRTLGLPINGDAEIRDAYRRNMNEALDVATSYKYMMDIGAHMEASDISTQLENAEENELPPSPRSPTASAVPRGRSARAGKSAIKKPTPSRDTTPQKVQGSPVQHTREGERPKEETTPKGKRKVTFDVKPDVAIISNEGPSPAEIHPSPPQEEEPVFDMDNEIIGEGTDVVAPISLPLNQPSASVQEFTHARRPSRSRPVSTSGLPTSFSTLRPASLPLPSAILARGPVRSELGDERSRAQSVREHILSTFPDADGKRLITDEIREEPEEDEVTEREAEILKLVAASMPSHRSAWKKNSSAWQTFVNRQRASESDRTTTSESDDTSNGEGAGYYDESEDESEEELKGHWNDTTMSKSLPIPIGPLGSKKAGLPSLQPKSALPTGSRPVAAASVDKVSAAALRASYAERDRNRLLDPGALDFAVDDDDDDEDEEGVAGANAGSKSRQLALKILQKRSKIPADGLWRSMA